MPTKIYSGIDGPRDLPVRVTPTQVKKVAIIGGGASGAIALDSLIKEGHVEEIVLFERRDKFGGVWVFDDKQSNASAPHIKVGAFSGEIDPPLSNPFLEDFDDERKKKTHDKLRLLPSGQERFEATPAYEKMKTNIVENMMTFSDERHWADAPGGHYAERELVQKYIERYIGRHLQNSKVRIELNTTVEDLARTPKPDADIPYAFRATLRQHLADGTDLWYQEEFDTIIVATGHYHVPFIPEVTGSKFVEKTYPGVFEHAKFFTNGEKYKDKVVIVVGSRALGTDLTRFTAEHAEKVYQLIRNPTNTRILPKGENVEAKPVIDRFAETRTGFDVIFADGSLVSNPDHVIYATGYQFLYPFLRREYGDITQNGSIVPQLYQLTFLLNEPLISILGVPTDAISFRAFEYQAILVSRFLAGKIALPSWQEQEQWVQERLKKYGQTRAFHTIGISEGKKYMEELTELGTLKQGEIVTGREFATILQAEVDEIVSAAQESLKMWDDVE